MVKIKFTTTFDEQLLEKVKIKCIKKRKRVNQVIEELLKKWLKKKD